MTKLTAQFVNAEKAKLTIFFRPGKRGISVGFKLKPKGQPAQSGPRQTVAAEADAKSAFDKLTAEAKKAGWAEAKPKAERVTLTAIPQAKAAKGSKAA